MAGIVNPKEFVSQDTVAHARSLLGRWLVRTTVLGRAAGMITEVEPCDGETDLACHASKGRTRRTEIMFQPGGVWYVYPKCIPWTGFF